MREQTEDKLNIFLETLTQYHQVRAVPEGLHHAIGSASQSLSSLNSILRDSNESSTKLAVALNRITFAATIISAFGLLLGFANLGFEIWKYLGA